MALQGKKYNSNYGISLQITAILYIKGYYTPSFCEILARHYAPGAAAPGTVTPEA